MDDMNKRLEELPKLAREVKKENQKYFARLKKRPQKRLDYLMQEIHDAEFKKTDCLDCGNCCRTTSPIFTEKDIQRISKHLRMKEADFINQYIDRDEDDFYVLKSVPCTFFDETDNSCFIYDVRPKACSDYPHTNRKKFIKITDLAVQNTEVCPAVYSIIEKLKEKLPLQSNIKKKRS